MAKKKAYFMGLLANTDSTILAVDLDHGFKIEDISQGNAISLISTIEGIPYEVARENLFFNPPYLDSSGSKLYYIGNSFDISFEVNDEGIWLNFPHDLENFRHNLDLGYVQPVILLMRLFKEGNICIPIKYYYFVDNNTPKSLGRESTVFWMPPEPKFTLVHSELPGLQRLIQDTKLPFKEEFLQLAFDNFNLSYQTYNINLSFLSLMISLEALFNPGGQELRYRVSRNIAVLLGKGKDDSKLIFSEIKDLYDKRSNIVHAGKSNIISKDDLLKLRFYVREAIKEVINMGKNKTELLDMLNSCGFGEKQWSRQTI